MMKQKKNIKKKKHADKKLNNNKVPVVVVRDGAEITLQITLDPPK